MTAAQGGAALEEHTAAHAGGGGRHPVAGQLCEPPISPTGRKRHWARLKDCWVVIELLFSGRAGGRPGCAKTGKGLEVGAILCELDVRVVSAAVAGVAFAP